MLKFLSAGEKRIDEARGGELLNESLDGDGGHEFVDMFDANADASEFVDEGFGSEIGGSGESKDLDDVLVELLEGPFHGHEKRLIETMVSFFVGVGEVLLGNVVCEDVTGGEVIEEVARAKGVWGSEGISSGLFVRWRSSAPRLPALKFVPRLLETVMEDMMRNDTMKFDGKREDGLDSVEEGGGVECLMRDGRSPAAGLNRLSCTHFRFFYFYYFSTVL